MGEKMELGHENWGPRLKSYAQEHTKTKKEFLTSKCTKSTDFDGKRGSPLRILMKMVVEDCIDDAKISIGA